jgi:hypothetical protein
VFGVKMQKFLNVMLILFAGIILTACAGKSIPEKSAIICPPAIMDSSGEYMCPYTQDGVLAEWTDNAINASMGAAVGKMAGAYAGQKALEFVPIVGGILGSYAGEAVGRKVALAMAGGEEFIRESSDLSFNTLEDMAVYLYVNYSEHEHYQAAIKCTGEIYPDFPKIYMVALQNAPTR